MWRTCREKHWPSVHLYILPGGGRSYEEAQNSGKGQKPRMLGKKGCSFIHKVRDSLSAKVICEQTCMKSGQRIFQNERTESTKLLRQGNAWCIWGTVKKSVKPKQEEVEWWQEVRSGVPRARLWSLRLSFFILKYCDHTYLILLWELSKTIHTTQLKQYLAHGRCLLKHTIVITITITAIIHWYLLSWQTLSPSSVLPRLTIQNWKESSQKQTICTCRNSNDVP